MVGKEEFSEEVTFDQRLKGLGVKSCKNLTKGGQVEAKANACIFVLTSLL